MNPIPSQQEVTVDADEVLPQELQNALDSIVLDIDRRDEFARDRLLRVYKRNEFFWEGIQNLYFSEVAHDYQSISSINDPDYLNNQDLDSKIVNIYKAHGEIIVAAVSQSIPATQFYPRDADVPADIYTAAAYTKLCQLIRQHNKAPFLFMKAIGLLYNQGIVAAYTYNDENPKYGTESVPHYRQDVQKTTTQFCPECGEDLTSVSLAGGDELRPDEMPHIPTDSVAQSMPPAPQAPMPAEESIAEPLQQLDQMAQADNPIPPEEPAPEFQEPAPMEPSLMEPPITGGTTCPNCGSMVNPIQDEVEEPVQVEDYVEEIPKCREIIELWGGTNVQIYPRARTLADSGYLILNTEHETAQMQEKFPHIADKIVPTADTERYDRWARTPAVVGADDDSDICTCRQVWLRPWMFNKIGKFDDERTQELKRRFPNGARAIYINDILAEITDENMDDHWTVSVNPINDRIFGSPIANSIVPIQEMTNEMFQLTIETIRYGIPETFVDSSVIDMQKYRDTEVAPGTLYPVKAPAGGSISEAFYTNKAALLSREHKEFSSDLNAAGQFVLGTVPSVYGGTQTGGSDTAAEYSMSRAQALQRLQITYKMISFFWSDMEGKATKDYAKNMKTDEKIVKSQGRNSYINVWIRRAEMNGQVGQIEPELSEQFPLSWAQKRDVIMRLLELNNDALNEALFHPENRHAVADIVGVPEITVPGDSDRTKQLYEISELLLGQPMIAGINPMDGTPQLKSSVPPDKDVDDHTVHGAVLKEWCVSEIGMDQKETNPGGYMNVVAHLQEHIAMEKQAMMEQAMMMGGAPQGPPNEKGSPPRAKESNIPAPKGVQDA